MRFSVSPRARIVLRVRVFGSAGEREVEGLLDTGAAFLSIPPRDAMALGYDLQHAPRVRLRTAGGIVSAPEIVLSRVIFGEFEEANVPAVCAELPGGTFSALLGRSLLDRFKITMNVKGGTLEVVDP